VAGSATICQRQFVTEARNFERLLCAGGELRVVMSSALGIRNCNTAHRGTRCAVSISEWLGHSKIGVHVTWFMYVLARDQTLLMAATGSSICTVNTSRLPILKRSIAHRAKLHLWLWTWIAGLRPDRSQNPPPGFSSA
jgi:hypothetical protein